MDLLGVVGVEAQEVCKLTRGVNLRLETVLALRQHGRRVDLRAVWPGDQVGGLQEHRRAMFPRQGRPGWTGRQGRVDGCLHVACVAVTEVTEDFPVLMWGRHGALVACADLIRADVHGDLDGVLVVHLGVGLLQRFALGRARGVAQHGFVDWVGDVESSVGHGV